MRGRIARAGWVLVVLTGGVWGCGGPSGPGEPGAPGGSADPGVMFVGFDASPPLVEALSQGVLHGVVVQDPFEMGYRGVKTLVDHLEGRPVEKTVSTGETLVTPENMDQPEIQKLLNPPKVDHTADTSPAGGQGASFRVMVIPKGTTHEHWKSVHAGAVEAARELGNVEVVWIGPTTENDRTEQIKLVEAAIASRVDGIALAPIDSEALVPPVEQAVAKEIPVVILDSALNSDAPISYIATDNYHGGVLAGQRLAELLGGQGRIILLRYMVGSASTEEREKGFTDTIAKYPGITYLSDDQYAGGTSDSAQKVAQSLVTRFRGRVDGVFTPNESSTSGMLRALRDAGMLKKLGPGSEQVGP